MTDIQFAERSIYTPFVYLIANSFFSAAREGLDPVFQKLEAYETCHTEDQVDSDSLAAISQKFQSLSYMDQVQIFGMCVRATTNLGLAYAHFMRLLTLLDTGVESLQAQAHPTVPELVSLFDDLPESIQRELNETYHSVGAYDFFVNVKFDPNSTGNSEEFRAKPSSFRQQLVEWQDGKLMQESHRLFAQSMEKDYRILVPLQSVFLLDRIIGRLVAPRMNIKYQEMDFRMSSHAGIPNISWNGKNFSISLSDKLGKTLQTEWEPEHTHVVRIREKGTEVWSPGFQTPFTMCEFTGLKPKTEYEAQITSTSKIDGPHTQTVRFWSDSDKTESNDA